MKLDDRAVRWLLVPAIVFLSQTISDAYLQDFWHHLARGREIVASGRLLDHDIFTYTVDGQPFQDVNWGSQVVYFTLWRIGGLGLVRVMNALVLAAAWAWLIAICRRESGSLEAAVIVGLLAFLGSFQVLTIRPQTFSILLFIAMLDVLLRAERERRWLWGTLPIMVLWSNLHGAFPAGIILVGCSWAAACAQAVVAPLSRGLRRKRTADGQNGRGRGAGGKGESSDPGASSSPLTPGPSPPAGDFAASGAFPAAGGEGSESRLGIAGAWTAALIGSVAATLVNPYGWDIYRYARATSGISARRHIDEWLPPSFEQWAGIAFWLSLPIAVGLLVAVLLEAKRNRLGQTLRDLLQMLVFFVMTIEAIRMVVWWFLILAPILARRLVAVFPRLKVTRYEPNLGATVSVVGLVGVCLLCLPPLHPINPLVLLRPHDATTERLQAARDFLVEKYGGGRVFTQLAWGEYMSWAASPEWKTHMDGRIEIIPDDAWDDYVRIMHGEDAGFEALRRYGVDTLLLDSVKQAGLCQRVETADEWRKVWESGNVVIYRRASRTP